MKYIIIILVLLETTFSLSQNIKFINCPDVFLAKRHINDTLFLEIVYNEIPDTMHIRVDCFDQDKNSEPTCQTNNNVHILLPKSQGSFFVPLFIGKDSIGKSEKPVNLKLVYIKHINDIYGIKPVVMTDTILDERIIIFKGHVSENKYQSDCNIALGANFNLIQGPVINDLYSDIKLFIPSLFDILGSPFGLYTALEKNNFFQSNDIINTNYYRDIPPVIRDTMNRKYLRLKMGGRLATTTESYRIMIEPLFELTDMSGRDNIGKIFLGIKIDYLYNRISQNYNYNDTINADTINSKVLATNPFTRSIINEEHATSFSPSFLLFLKQNMFEHGFQFELHVSPLGYTHTLTNDIASDFANYSYSFEMKDINTNLKIGGEIRGFYGSYKPYYSLYIAKCFNLSKLGEFILKD
jgi:hypothetical protein